MIRVLVVDDSSTARRVLTQELGRAPDLVVVGTAADGLEAHRLIRRLRPDVITLDLEMPGMNGLAFLEGLMARDPLPVVVVSSLNARRGATTLRALELGAIEVVGKARLGSHRDAAVPLVDAVRAAAHSRLPRIVHEPVERIRPPSAPFHCTSCEVVAIGASTGGPRALAQLLQRLSIETPGVVIAQHLPAAFTRSFAERLDGVSELSVREARDGDLVVPGTALVAPGDLDLRIVRESGRLCVRLANRTAQGNAPSVDVLFHSAVQAAGPNAVGILLTGMGDDGAHGLAAMRRARAFTIAESEESCVVFGMPAAAIALDAAEAVVPLHRMADLLSRTLERPLSGRL